MHSQLTHVRGRRVLCNQPIVTVRSASHQFILIILIYFLDIYVSQNTNTVCGYAIKSELFELLWNLSMNLLEFTATTTAAVVLAFSFFAFLIVSQYPSPCLLSTPPLSQSPTEVRYCISGRPFFTVSNAHQIPQVGGLRGLIGYNAFTYTKGLREEITFKVAPGLHRTSGPPLAFSREWKSCGS